mmetsp:Transcript_256/g.545  ORF Transcript_256/g.545 Transcript_256/m.545 type:complete len:149 (-) Transcript_256:335-781(-)
MKNVCAIINHSNGRTLYRRRTRQRRKRSPSSSTIRAVQFEPPGACSRLLDLASDVLYTAYEVTSFVQKNWLDLSVWCLIFILWGVRFCTDLLTEILVSTLEIICSKLAGCGGHLFLLVLLIRGDMVAACIWMIKYQNCFTQDDSLLIE